MSESTEYECCPPFDPAPWDEKTFTWDAKPFIKDHVRSFLHIPLNFGGVMTRCAEAIKAADAEAEEMVVLSDEKSPWGADVYVAVSKDVPGVNMATISGAFVSKVFEGPYRDIRKWIQDMTAYVGAQDKDLKKMYFYYTTCPKCAKKYGKNYVVILAEV